MDQQTIATYNKLATEYDNETTDFWERFPKTFFDEFSQKVNGKVLDVGSGPGRDGVLLQQRGLEVVCLDASEAMLELCKQKGLNTIQGDFMSLPFPDGSFSGVWAYTSLLHVNKAVITQALKEIHRVLKSGGAFGLGMIEGVGESYRESSGVDQPRWFSYYTQEELEKLLTENGFTIEYFETIQPRSKKYLHFISKKYK
jgi:ubiquinone/menaquinone biosynthesis C-methylase UbiE